MENIYDTLDIPSHDAVGEERTSFKRRSSFDSILMTSDVVDEIQHSFCLSDQNQNIISEICRQQTGLITDNASPDVDDLDTRGPMRRSRLASDAEAHREIDSSWYQEKTHVFVMSRSGKPIYTLHGDENNLVNQFSLLSMLVSFVEDKNKGENDTITSINMDGIKFIFLLKYPLIFVATTRHQFTEKQVQVQLNDVYNLILSIVTLRNLEFVFKRENYDLRRLLIGKEDQITNLLNSHTGCNAVSNIPFTHLTNSMSVLKLQPSDRDAITSAIKQGCSKIKNLFLAVMIAVNKVVAVVSLGDYKLHPADLRLLINILNSSEKYKTAEDWTPICLPHLDNKAYLNAYISSLVPNSVSESITDLEINLGFHSILESDPYFASY
jgi:First Longin domain of FUZ, MON1 and HPS1/Second Longin domain of FUZ, MON1 and HPS1